MTISQNSAIWNCTNTWKGVFFSLFSTCFCFPFFLLPHLHLRWLLILTSKIVQTTSVVRLHPPHTHIHSHTFFQIIVELNHNSLIKRRNQAFAPNSHLWGKSSIKIAHFSFYSFLTFRGVVVAAPLSQDTSGNPSFYTFIPSPLESLPQAPPLQRNQDWEKISCYFADVTETKRSHLSLSPFDTQNFSPIPKQVHHFPNVWREIRKWEGDLKYTYCLDSKLQWLFLMIPTVLWKGYYSLHFLSEQASQRLEICPSPNMKWSRGTWCHWSITSIFLLPPEKNPPIPYNTLCFSTLTFASLDIRRNMKVFCFWCHIFCYFFSTRFNNLLGVGNLSLFIKHLFLILHINQAN